MSADDLAKQEEKAAHLLVLSGPLDILLADLDHRGRGSDRRRSLLALSESLELAEERSSWRDDPRRRPAPREVDARLTR